MSQSNDTRINQVLASTQCTKHSVGHGEPCWYLMDHPAVCGSRLRAAGYTGSVSPNSLRRSAGNRPMRPVDSKEKK